MASDVLFTVTISPTERGLLQCPFDLGKTLLAVDLQNPTDCRLLLDLQSSGYITVKSERDGVGAMAVPESFVDGMMHVKVAGPKCGDSDHFYAPKSKGCLCGKFANCPTCGVANESDRATCYNCAAPMMVPREVELQEGPGVDQPIGEMRPEPQPKPETWRDRPKML